MISLEKTRQWSARWIGAGDNHINAFVKALPAPYFRREFQFDGRPGPVVAYWCGLGYSVLFINGKRVGSRELSPVATEFDKRARYLSCDIRDYLRPGKNAIGVVLGKGWYDNRDHNHWHFDRASWCDYPKLLLEIRQGRRTLLKSDSTWRVTKEGPLVYDSLMTGEIVDARKDLGAWTQAGYDDSAWAVARVVPGPGGVLTEENFPPVQVVESLPMTETRTQGVWDVGKIIAGWARIHVKGEAGAQVKLMFSDELSPDGTLFFGHNGIYCDDARFQTDTYILKGEADGETWAPMFTYHGFRYVAVSITGNASLVSLTGESISSAARRIGYFECSDPTLNRLLECTVNSYVANFPGFPTDCPHREKLGWTGDAHCAVETGLSLFDMADNYVGWLQSIADSQRINGQLPGIVPSSGWGYNWGNGAFFDYVLPGIMMAAYRFTGDVAIIRQFYPNLQRLLAYYDTIAEQRILRIGLGDWSHFIREERADDALVLTAFYYAHATAAADCAKILHHREEMRRYRSLATSIARAFDKRFYHGEGVYGKGEPTAQALPVYFGMCPKARIPQVVAKLDETLRQHDYQAYFGIVGAKCIPMVLSQYGYADAALKLVTQKQVPGWGAWVDDGATALRESWGSDKSHCHIMFGAIVWWMFRHLAGLSPELDKPGWQTLRIAPAIPEQLEWVKASTQTPFGPVAVAWRKTAYDTILFDLDLPEGIQAILALPGHDEKPVSSGHQIVELGIRN